MKDNIIYNRLIAISESGKKLIATICRTADFSHAGETYSRFTHIRHNNTINGITPLSDDYFITMPDGNLWSRHRGWKPVECLKNRYDNIQDIAGNVISTVKPYSNKRIIINPSMGVPEIWDLLHYEITDKNPSRSVLGYPSDSNNQSKTQATALTDQRVLTWSKKTLKVWTERVDETQLASVHHLEEQLSDESDFHAWPLFAGMFLSSSKKQDQTVVRIWSKTLEPFELAIPDQDVKYAMALSKNSFLTLLKNNALFLWQWSEIDGRWDPTFIDKNISRVYPFLNHQFVTCYLWGEGKIWARNTDDSPWTNTTVSRSPYEVITVWGLDNRFILISGIDSQSLNAAHGYNNRIVFEYNDQMHCIQLNTDSRLQCGTMLIDDYLLTAAGQTIQIWDLAQQPEPLTPPPLYDAGLESDTDSEGRGY